METGTRKKDLEIVYNLHWKDKDANGGDKANIIGMYDIPATTLNWEIFKSYLLKNSGAVGEDVKVYYITDSKREFPIDSQTDFQIALYAFRRKARMGDIVHLKLERFPLQLPVNVPIFEDCKYISRTALKQEPFKNTSRSSNDVETQYNNSEAVPLPSNCCNTTDAPPEWFITYMSQFRKEIKDDVSSTVSGILSNLKPHAPPQPSCYHSRKSKVESSKRLRKLPHFTDSSHETKELLKSIKIEGKLEKKLEKLEHKTKKIREKKIALFSKSSDSEGHSRRKDDSDYSPKRSEIDDEYFEQMQGSPVISEDPVPHMLGGEVYLHKWRILNTGDIDWPEGVTLNYTWGAKALKPLDDNIPVKALLTDSVDTVSVRFQVPDEPGHYECYWHLHYRGRRFGHWFGCEVIVDPFDLKGHKSVMECNIALPFEEFIKERKPMQHVDGPSDGAEVHQEREDKYGVLLNETDPPTNNFQNSSEQVVDSVVRNISRQMGDIKLQDPTDTNCSSDSDNQSIASLNGISSPKLRDDFEVVDSIRPVDLPGYLTPARREKRPSYLRTIVGIPNQYKVEEVNCDNNNNNGEANQNCQITNPSDDISSTCSQKSDIILVSLNDESDGENEYAYVLVEGQKSSVPVPKKIIKSEYLEGSEKRSRQGTLSRASSTGSSVEIINKADLTTDSGSSPRNEQDPLSQQPEETPLVEIRQNIKENEAQKSSESVKQPFFQFQPSFNQSTGQEENTNEGASHCSAAGTCFSEDIPSMQRSSRMFVFPEDCPGYEVLEISNKFSNESNDSDELPFNFPVRGPFRCFNPPARNVPMHEANPFSSRYMCYMPNYQQTSKDRHPEYSYPKLKPESALFQFPETCVPPSETFLSATEFEADSIQPQQQQQQEENRPTSSARASSISSERRQENPVHILPETLVNGAVNVASSAINTARSVINMIRPQEQPGTWINGRWVSANTETLREANLQSLAEMGFWNRDLNATLLARFNDDLTRVVTELVQ